ncbi:MAG: transporter substrate-binding domain-containing protein [Bacteroides sp.]|nr:transporter substrate-binding domain-containing protein [Bacillota bacterium]MCM1393854.1 transporter substrate-binding domain-containing protein [[Eubacterium] siraeum]MCM1455022.1 transporter substrate-binding domain-containing protein [Bacteroides sp.]
MKKSIKVLSVIMCVAVIGVACFALAACNNDNKTGLEDGKLNVATNCFFEPFEYLDPDNDVFVGIDIDIMAAIAEELGVEVEYNHMTFSSVVAAVGAGTHDIAAAGLTITETRKETVDFTQTYFSSSQVVIAKTGDPILALTEADDVEAALAGKNIGVQAGTTGYFYASGASDDYDGVTDASKVKPYDSGAAAVDALLNGQVDYVIIDAVPAKKLVAAKSGTAVSSVVLTGEDYAFAVKKGNKELLEKVDAALTKLIQNGKIEEIFQKYGETSGLGANNEA